jgi:hypothetical protein
MASAGGVRADLTADKAITRDEVRPLRWVVKDADGVNISSFSGWEIKLFVVTSLEFNGLVALAAGASLMLTAADGLTISAPNVDWTLRAADWAVIGVLSQSPWYELWRTDVTSPNRLAYGRLVIVS